MKTKLIILAILFITINTTAQEMITLNISQDAKLAFVGDDKGNTPITWDLAFRSEWQGKQTASGYLFVAPEYEYADLNEVYHRFSLNAGYTFNLLFEGWETFIIDPSKLTATVSAGYGMIKHRGAYLVFGGNFQLGYEVGVFTLFVDLEIVDRKDLQSYTFEELNLNDRIVYSGKFGVKIDLFNTRIKKW